jgi:hypothetical protein
MAISSSKRDVVRDESLAALNVASVTMWTAFFWTSPMELLIYTNMH